MPFSVSIHAVPSVGQTPWCLDPVDWWDSDALRGDPRFRPVLRTEGYRDFAAVLSRDETREWHHEQRHRATEGVYEYEGWQAVVRPKLAALDATLEGDRGPEFFVVLVSEWEGGF